MVNPLSTAVEILVIPGHCLECAVALPQPIRLQPSESTEMIRIQHLQLCL